MLNVTAQVVGGRKQVLELSEGSTVKDAMQAIGLEGSYSASVNGSPATLDEKLNDYVFVTFSEKIKGGL